jgi:ABC-type branched-subunit amino acid transport system substrate-binding protein
MGRKLTASGTFCLLLMLLAACASPIPTAPVALDTTTPTALPPTSTSTSPTGEVVTNRFLYVQGVTVSTLAGDGHWGHRDGPGDQARFNGIEGGMAVDSKGNVYVAERFGHRIRRVDPDGMVSTLAGTGAPGYADGPSAIAQFNYPHGVAVDVDGNVYVADTNNHRIRVIPPDGTVSTLAGDGEAGHRDGAAGQAQFNAPTDVAADAEGVVYVADSRNDRVRAISPDGMVTTLAGSGERGFRDGPPDQAQFNGPYRLTVDDGGNIYVTDSLDREYRGNHAVRRITPEGMVTTIAGTGQPGFADGPVVEAGFNQLSGVAMDAVGNVYVADELNQRIRVITPEGMVYTLAGTGASGYADGQGTEATFFWPKGVVLDGTGRLYVADFASNRIRVLHLPETLVAAPPSPMPDPYAGQNVIKIGFVDEPGYPAAMSVTTRQGAQLAVDEANAAGGVMVGGTRYSFGLVTAQDWYQPPDADAQAAAHTLLDQAVVAVVGHIRSENSIAAAEVYGPAGVVMVSVISSDPRLTQAGWPTVYRVTSNDSFLAPVAARMTYEELGIRRVVLLGEPDPHVQTSMGAWQEAFESLGGQVLGRFEAEVEFPAEVMAQVETLSPEAAIFFPFRGLNTPRAVQQVQETGVDPVIVGVEIFSDLPSFMFALGDAAEGIYDVVTGQPRAAMPDYTDFAGRYREADFDTMPDPDHELAKWAPFGYDATGVIIAAVRRAAETGEVTRESVAAGMDTFHDEPYQGVTGFIQFDEYGDLLEQPVYFKRVVDGQWVDVVP